MTLASANAASGSNDGSSSVRLQAGVPDGTGAYGEIQLFSGSVGVVFDALGLMDFVGHVLDFNHPTNGNAFAWDLSGPTIQAASLQGFEFWTSGSGTDIKFTTTGSETESFRVVSGGGVTVSHGALSVVTTGFGLKVAEGSNAKQGTATLVAGTAVVSNTSVTANSRIFLTAQSLGTVSIPTALAVTARSAGTSFTITSANAIDTSVIAYEIFEPA